MHLLTLPDGRIFLNFIDDTCVPFCGSQASARGVFLKGPVSFFFGGPRNATADGGQGDDVMRGAGGGDVLNGLAGDDQVSGGDGSDILSGGLGQDQVNGGDGNDSIDGDAGGAGADHFDFGTIFTEGAIGKDAITDFQIGVDVILLTHWNLAFGVTLTLESRTNGCALVTAMGDAIFLRGVTTAAFSQDDVLH